VTHHLPDIVPEIERVITIREGRLECDAPKRDALTDERLGRLFNVPVEVLERRGYFQVV
jgi:iron complex transport system ATP-binding protein